MIEDILKSIEENKKFGRMDIKVVEKVWGREIWIANLDYCSKILEINKGWCSSLHYHKIKSELLLVYKGLIGMEHSYNNWLMGRGNGQHVFPMETHRFTAFEDSRIIEFSTHHDDDDVVRSEFGRKLSPDELNELYKKLSIPYKK